MKALVAILLFCGLQVKAGEHNWYRIYLTSKITKHPSFTYPVRPSIDHFLCGGGISPFTIPHFQRPKGAIFCRMEDYLTTKTKVWIKVGVK